MDHDKFKEWLQLSMYDELNDDERQLLARHLESCTECQEELKKLKQFNLILAEYKPTEATDELLGEARQHFRVALRQQRSRRGFLEFIVEVLQETIIGQYKIALGGAGVLAIGVLLGYVIFYSPQQRGAQLSPQVASNESTPMIPGETRISNVRFINTDLVNGQVEFTFDAVKPVRMKGSINDEQVQKVLTHALLSEQNPGVRLQSINTIAASSLKQDKEIKSALITSLKTDENAGVRREALKALEKYPMDRDVKQTILFVLTHDKNPGIRIAAINYLDSVKVAGGTFDRDVINVLRDKMQTDDNDYIRLRAKAAIEEIKQQ